MGKRRNIRPSTSSDTDSDDECLLEVLKKKRATCDAAQTYHINLKNSLCRPSEESCEFCDKTFTNRLDVLVHNATHIIIPLLRNTGFNRTIPDHHNRNTLPTSEASSDTFNNRIILGNSKKPVGIKNRIVFEDDDVISISDSDDDTKSGIVAQVKLNTKEANVLSSFVTDCKVVLSDSMVLLNNAKDLEDKAVKENKLLNSFTAECKVALGTPLSFEVERKTSKDGNRQIVTLKSNGSPEKKSPVTPSKLKERRMTLKKKESIEKITHQLENMCLPLDKHKINHIEPRIVPVADLFSNQNGNKTPVVDDIIQFTPKLKKEDNDDVKPLETSDIASELQETQDDVPQVVPKSEQEQPTPEINETVYKSVHYDDLQKPGLFKCDLCKYTFPNRYSAVKHRRKHLQIRIPKNNICVACNLLPCIPNSSVPLCPNCEWKQSSHNREDYVDVETVQSGQNVPTFKDQADITLKVCEVCCVFMLRLSRWCKPKGNTSVRLTYTQTGDVWNNMDEPCENCGKIYNRLKLINKNYTTYTRNVEPVKMASRIQFEEPESKYKKQYGAGGKTNADRLGRIRSRIKKLNFINKF